MRTPDVDCLIIGAGVVGLAIARALALRGFDVVICERHATFGDETSSRNSEVIHAGIYYPQGSLKARHCVRGRELLYAYCDTHQVPARRCGKWIVATSPAQIEQLASIQSHAAASGVTLEWLPRAAWQDSPLNADAVLVSPETGIVDSHRLMLSLLGEIEDHGGRLVRRAEVTEIAVESQGLTVQTTGNDSVLARWVINSAGLGAHAVANVIAGFPACQLPPRLMAKGSYFSLRGRSPFSHLVYPVPEPGGLGIHLTLDLAGQARFGPDVEWVSEENYLVDPSRAEAYYHAIRRYWPCLPDGALVPAYAGIRPKISGPDQPAADFMIQGPADHGMPGVINLFGIESPGLTSCLSLAEAVAELVI